MDKRYYLSSPGLINALGNHVSEISKGLFAGNTKGMQLESNWLTDSVKTEARVGRAHGELTTIPAQWADYNCRNNQLLLAALAQIENVLDTAITHYGHHRIGIVLGSSTAGIAEGEAAFSARHENGVLPDDYRYTQQEIGSPARFLAKYLGITGPSYTICNACTSSAKAFQTARNLLRFNLCDAVLVGGVDSLCRTTVNGFSSLESITSELTNPMSLNRKGINIGESAALFILSTEESPVEILGIGESSDAYHMSAPQPEGIGAEIAIRAALKEANLAEKNIDYLNLHATATPKNDAMESCAVARIFPEGILCSGTKPLTGHTLGAAGVTELAFCWLALQQNKIPPHVWDNVADPELPALNFANTNHAFPHQKNRTCMSNSFAFGGSNTSLIIGDSR